MQAFPLTAPIDLGTKDIIQATPQFKRKNSIVYKGLLSNMTTASGEGFLSTTGKTIKYTDGKIYTGEQSFVVTGDSYLVTHDPISTSKDVMHARYIDDVVIAIHKVSQNLLTLEAFKDGQSISRYDFEGSSSVVDASGFVFDTKNIALVFQSYDDEEYSSVLTFFEWTGTEFKSVSTIPLSYELFKDFGTDNMGRKFYTDSKKQIGMDLSGGIRNGYLWIGFDDTDMRNRYSLSFNMEDGYATDMTTMVQGMGCIDDEAEMITGEPFLVDVSASMVDRTTQQVARYPHILNAQLTNGVVVDNDDGFAGYYVLNNIPQWNLNRVSYNMYDGIYTNQINLDSSYIADIGTMTANGIDHPIYRMMAGMNIKGKVLDNGVFQTSWNSLSSTSGQYYVGGSRIVSEDRTVQSQTTTYKSWIENLGINNTTYGTGTQSGVAGWLDANGLYGSYASQIQVPLQLTDDKYEAFNCAANRFWCYALAINDNGTVSLRIIQAFGHTQLMTAPWTITYTGTGIYNDSETRIGVIGMITDAGGKDVSDGKQVWPHVRLFENDTTKKGINYDYGKGWVRFIYDTLSVLRYPTYGLAVFEAPLRMMTFTKENINTYTQGNTYRVPTPDVIELDFSSSNTDTLTSADRWTMAKNNWPLSEMNEWTGETLMLRISDPSYTTNYNDVYPYTAWNAMKATLRLHPYVQQQIDGENWYWNHSIGGMHTESILPLLPFHAQVTDNINAQLYNNQKISLSYNKVLLTTPTDVGESYSVNDDNICIWGAGKIQYASISHNDSDLTIHKVADYIFMTNILGERNVITEDHNGFFTFEQACYSYCMESKGRARYNAVWKIANDSTSYVSNDIHYFGFGINPLLDEDRIAASFIFPAVTIQGYLASENLTEFNRLAINSRKYIFYADTSELFPLTEVDEYFTHSQATTDVGYKNSRYLEGTTEREKWNDDLAGTSWPATDDYILYPIGVMSVTYGENYVTSTVDVGNNYTSRFYNKNNKTFLNFNQKDQIYYGNEIFTIMGGNYYFDGQGIYYLGSQQDYTQNIFTAYAIGMTFLANSSTEAYFYAPWDRNIYVFTASNTLQKSFSVADMGEIVDAVYSSAEQSLYILFDTQQVYIKTQVDDCLLSATGTTLQTTEQGCQILGDNTYIIFNPYTYTTLVPLSIETEWVGNGDIVSKYNYIDVVLYSETSDVYDCVVTVDVLNGGTITTIPRPIHISSTDWKNHLYRERIVPHDITGLAVKVSCTSDKISIHSISISVQEGSQVPAAARKARQ